MLLHADLVVGAGAGDGDGEFGAGILLFPGGGSLLCWRIPAEVAMTAATATEAPKNPQKPSLVPAPPEALGPLQQLMYGLIYPGVLGTGIVLTAVRAAHEHFKQVVVDPSVLVGIVAGLFFCASFDSAFYWPEDEKTNGHYGRMAFFIDAVEVVLMFACFHFLRLFEDPTKTEAPYLPAAYGLLAADVLLQFLWRGAVGLKMGYRWEMRCFAAAVLVTGACLGWRYGWINLAVCGLFLAVLILYVLFDPRYKRG